MASPHAKRKNLDIDKKYQMICAVNAGNRKKQDIAAEFGVKQNTLSTILKNKDAIIQAFESSNYSPARKRMRTAAHSDVQDALYEWFKVVRSKNIPVSGPTLMTKANSLASELGLTNFSATNGFIERFKNRHGIVSKVLCGEGAAASETDADNWKNNKLPHLIENVEPRNIFNIDETGLFYKMTPNRTLDVRGQKCFGGKQSKERITVLVGANMDGSEKIKLLVIGKFKNPRCFKNVKSLPVDYEANKRAWMNSQLFIDWVRKLDKVMTKQKRTILLFNDNCPAHPHIEGLKSIKLLFFPPNLTSKLQPCDQGIIYSLKQHYRSRVLHHLLECLDSSTTPQINVLNAIEWIYAAWSCVTPTTIQNCFRKAGFTQAAASADDIDDDDDDVPLSEAYDLPLSVLRDRWKSISEREQLDTDISLDAYINADVEIVATEEKTESDIVKEIKDRKCEHISDSDSSNSDCDAPSDRDPPTESEFVQSIGTCKRYLLSKETVPDDMFDYVCKLEQFAINNQSKKKQAKLTDFFQKK